MGFSLFQKIINKFLLLRDRRYNVAILRQKGVQIGEKTGIQTGCYLDPAYPYLITIGKHCVLSNNVTILAHDASLDRFMGACIIGRVEIKDWCFIGINVTILPNVTIGPHSIVGAGAIVTKDVPPHTVVAGNPAKVISSLEEYLAHHEAALKINPTFPRKLYDKSNLSESLRSELVKGVEKNISFLVGED